MLVVLCLLQFSSYFTWTCVCEFVAKPTLQQHHHFLRFFLLPLGIYDTLWKLSPRHNIYRISLHLHTRNKRSTKKKPHSWSSILVDNWTRLPWVFLLFIFFFSFVSYPMPFMCVKREVRVMRFVSLFNAFYTCRER